jgi:hypothetical protein
MNAFEMWLAERKRQEKTKLSFLNTSPNPMFTECFLAQPVKIDESVRELGSKATPMPSTES